MEGPTPIPTGQTPPPTPTLAPEAKAPTMSLGARLLNVFAIPGEVFEDIKGSRSSAANWLVPALILALVGAVSVFVLFSQPNILQQVREQQSQVFEQKVKAGKMSQDDADKAMAMVDKFSTPTVIKVAGAFGAITVSFLRVLWWGFVLWVFGRLFFKAAVGFPKTLEIAGLSMMIVVLGTIVGMLLMVNLQTMGASPSLALAVKDFDVHRKSHLAMGAANIFSFWLIGVLSLGLAKVANVPFLRAAWLVFGFWLVQESLLIGIGLGQMAL